jgi:hypothetical protein
MTDVLDSIKDFITLMFNHNLDFSTVNRLNPSREAWSSFLDVGNGEIRSKFARFQFKRILDRGRVVRLMVILKDISKEVELEKRMKETQSEKENEMALFYRLIHLDPELLQGVHVDGLEEKLGEDERRAAVRAKCPQRSSAAADETGPQHQGGILLF